ncbi:hypothetical protein OH492_13295 [Vibrio chagasii]|nr:hypothetical protein [Vibrio chagasii]
MKSAYLLPVRRFKRAYQVIKHSPAKAPEQPDIAALMSQLAQSASNRRHRQTQPPYLSQKKYLTWLKASVGADIHLIAVDDVVYFKAEDKYVSIFKKGQWRAIRGVYSSCISKRVTRST